MAKVEKVKVNGKELTLKEKSVYEKVVELGKATANDLENQVGELNIYAIRATLARLEKTQGLLKAEPKLVGDRAVKCYEPQTEISE